MFNPRVVAKLADKSKTTYAASFKILYFSCGVLCDFENLFTSTSVSNIRVSQFTFNYTLTWVKLLFIFIRSVNGNGRRPGSSQRVGKEKLCLGGVKGESMADGQAKVVATRSWYFAYTLIGIEIRKYLENFT